MRLDSSAGNSISVSTVGKLKRHTGGRAWGAHEDQLGPDEGAITVLSAQC